MTWDVAAAHREAFAQAGLTSLGDVLAQATCIRDLKDRSNHELRLDDGIIHVKRHKPRRWRRWAHAPEAHGMRRAVDAGVRTAPLVFEAVDPSLGAATGTADLAPAVPLDVAWPTCRSSFRATRAITFDLARQVAALHGAGLHHKDLYVNHVFVHAGDALPTCTIIDWERLGEHHGAFPRWVVKDLAALEMSAVRAGVSRAARRRFFLAYFTARGESFDVWLRRVSDQVAARARRMARHVPRTPVGDAARPGSVAP